MSDKPTRAGEYIPTAFPSTFHNGWGEPEKGMALRDYFAAKAMQTLVSKHSHEGDVSRNAYKIADAMLKARQE
jgi:hypothetical protein